MDALSVEQVAKVLGVSPRRVRALIHAGRIPATRIGVRTYAVARADAEAFAKLPRPVGRPPRILPRCGRRPTATRPLRADA